MLPDDRSPLIKRLAEIMPKKATVNSLRIELHPIRQSAEAFTRYLDGMTPANEVELRDTLWVFGEILQGTMETMLNHMLKAQEDFRNTQILETIIKEKKDA